MRPISPCAYGDHEADRPEKIGGVHVFLKKCCFNGKLVQRPLTPGASPAVSYLSAHGNDIGTSHDNSSSRDDELMFTNSLFTDDPTLRLYTA
jgi:hypothetical protein